jgi:hypothetical protein
LHESGIYRDPDNLTDTNHWPWLQQYHGKPIYMQRQDELVPDSQQFPLEEIKRDLLSHVKQGDIRKGVKPIEYLTATVAYMLAYAIWKKYRKILIYGIELASTEEYVFQREGFAFWVGYAAGRGIDLEIYGASSVFNRPLYGYETNLTERLMKLSVLERIQLLNNLPKEGNIITMKIVRNLRNDLSFSEEELAEIKMVSIPDPNDPSRQNISWENEVEKDVTIGEVGRKVIIDTFKSLDEGKKITAELLALFERFSEGG